jgi:hypothetical protein
MWLLYFLPMLVAIAFLLTRVAQGGSLTLRGNWRQVAFGLLAIVVLGVLGVLLSGVLR